MSIQLYDLVGMDSDVFFSPHCWKTKMMLSHIGLDYESVPTRFTEIPTIENGSCKTLPSINHDELVVQDSFAIAQHFAGLSKEFEQKIFGGPGGEPMVRFIESWSQSQLHSWIMGWAILDIYALLDEKDQQYFRTSREALMGKTLEKIAEDREDTIPELIKRLLPLRLLLKQHDFIGGETPNFADFIVFGTFQWLRVSSSLQMIDSNHPAMAWFDRCLDLFDGLGRTVREGELTT